MKLKRRTKASKMRGTRYHGYAMKKHKGSGNRGGKGMAGTGKRADHKKSWVIKHQYPYFGKSGFTRGKNAKKVNNVINLKNIQENYKPGKINLSGFKILGNGEIKDKFIIKAESASKSAIAKIKKAGGEIEIKGMKKEEKKTIKEEKAK